jgi:probable F420-dependent oxidoreductase
MRVGVVFPQTEIGTAPSGVRDFAQAAYALGFEHLMAYDHVLGADASIRPGWTGYTSDSLFHEPFILFAYLTALLPRMEFVTGVIVLPQRETALVAKQAAELDILTAGKFRLGLGIGWNAVEYEALGKDFRNRAKRFEEQLEVLRRLWTEPIVTFEGNYHKISAAGLNPLPTRRPIPIWIGASAEPAIKRAAQLADGYFPQSPLDGSWEATFDKIHGWLREAGREPSQFGIDARISAASGSADAWRREAEEWRARGASHLSINTMGGGLVGPQAHIDRLREVAQAVLK